MAPKIVIPIAKALEAVVPGIGQLTYLGETAYFADEEESNSRWWSRVVTMQLRVNTLVNASDFSESMERVFPKWVLAHSKISEMGMLLQVRYEESIFDPLGVLIAWSNRLSETYREIRGQRKHFPKGHAIGDGTYAFKTGPGFKAKIYIFAHVALYDEYGSNHLVQTLTIEQVRVAHVLSEEVIEALPIVYQIPDRFFD